MAVDAKLEDLAVAGVIASPVLIQAASAAAGGSARPAATPDNTLTVEEGASVKVAAEIKNTGSSSIDVDAVIDIIRPDGSVVRTEEVDRTTIAAGDTVKEVYHDESRDEVRSQWLNVNTGNRETIFNQVGDYSLRFRAYQTDDVVGSEGNLPDIVNDNPLDTVELDNVFTVPDSGGGGGGGGGGDQAASVVSVTINGTQVYSKPVDTFGRNNLTV